MSTNQSLPTGMPVPEQVAIDTIRTLTMDAVQKANSGHPGTAMALAPLGHTIWTKYLRYDPSVPDWPNRDRFVLSIGHASMLLYSLLFLAGVDELDEHGAKTGRKAVTLGDIENFRQIGSKTPGHPEYRLTTGVETTTGPLGAGCGNSVGMAIAERWLAQHFNREGHEIFDHDVIVLCGDGDMMEGVTGEAASLAGHLKLAHLCWIYDSNAISIEGATSLAFTENVSKRFEAYGWNVLQVDDANDVGALSQAFDAFKATSDRPTFIVVRSVIGWGSPNAGSEKVHGEPLGVDAVRATKKAYGWPTEQNFYVPEGVLDQFRSSLGARGTALRQAWETSLPGYRRDYPELAAELDVMRAGMLPEGWDASLPIFEADATGLASRDSGGRVLNSLADALPWLVGGAADLAPSTKTDLKKWGSLSASNYVGRTVHFGVREHAMGAIVNGMALSSLRSFSATFLVFADYMRPPIRLAALMEIPSIFVFTHDSIGVGEDGPTHQPIEHLVGLRSIPNVDVIRPGDANEVREAWKVALSKTHTPTVLILSRQALPTLDRSAFRPAEGLCKGAYVLADSDKPEIILIGTGSEVSLVVTAHERLAEAGIRSRVVSMPSWHLFEKQDQKYRDGILPPRNPLRLAVEMGGGIGWDRFVGEKGRTITIPTFGASAPLPHLQERFGFTVDNVVRVAREMLAHHD